MTPKSQAKNNTPIPTTPILNYFLFYHANKYTVLSFNHIIRVYSNI